MENGKPIIVAVDDQPVILHALASELKGFCQVKAFTSGRAALAFLANHEADLIILDYEMPEMSGVEVMERLQSSKETSTIPIVFLTGSENGSIEVDVLERGASDYIQKPIKAKVLLSRVRLQIELARYRSHLEAMVTEQTEHLREANERLKMREEVTLNLLAEATDMRDHDTGGHINRVTEMVKIIVTDLLNLPTEGYILTPAEADDIVRSAKLHDMGKISVPDGILQKPGKLTKEEFDIIKQHPSHGAALFSRHIERMGNDSFLDTARDIALCHHEKWNGTGYPNSLKGTDIPLSARITALADVYDALTSVRPYKTALPHDSAVQIIKNDSGSHFDPYLVSVFLRHHLDFENISRS